MGSLVFEKNVKNTFLSRMIGPSIAVFFIGLIAVSKVVREAHWIQFQSAQQLIPTFDLSAPFYSKAITLWTHFPDVCQMGQANSDFQVHQCEELWNTFYRTSAVASFPLIFLLLSLFLAYTHISKTYQRVQKKIIKGAPSVAARVSKNPQAPFDFYNWFYCFRPVRADLGRGKELIVYMALDSESPQSGTPLALIEIPGILGGKNSDGKNSGGQNSSSEKRYFAYPYTPHVAVIRGS